MGVDAGKHPRAALRGGEGDRGGGGGGSASAWRLVSRGRREPLWRYSARAVAVKALHGGGAASSCCGGSDAGPVDPLSDMLHKTSPQQRSEALDKARKQGLIGKGGVDARTGAAATTPLMHAAELGRHDDVMLLVHAGADVLVKDKNGKTSLHFAAENGHLLAARTLMDFGGMRLLMIKNNRQRTPLMEASTKGHVETAIAIAKRGDKQHLMAVDEGGWSALHFAAEKGATPLVEFMAQVGGADLIMLQGNAKWNALHTAAANGRVETVQLLIDVGGHEQAMVKTDHGKRPLDLAMEYRKDAAANLLAPITSATPVMRSKHHTADFPSPGGHKMANKDAPRSPLEGGNAGGGKPFSPKGGSKPMSPKGGSKPMSPKVSPRRAEQAGAKGDSKMQSTMPDIVAGKVPSSRALSKKDALALAKQTKLIIGSTFDSGLEAKSGKLQQTPLIHAAEDGRGEDLRVLLAAGADVKAVSSDGSTAIIWASRTGRVSLLRQLIEHAGPEGVMPTSIRGRTALHWAAQAGHCEVAELLVRTGGRQLQEAQDEEGWTPLMRACEKGSLDVVKSLASHGGAELLKHRGRAGWTALMSASANGHTSVVEHLIEIGGLELVTEKNSDGKTAFDLAKKYKKDSTTALLDQKLQKYHEGKAQDFADRFG